MAVIFQDSFTESSDTDLDSHTPDAGTSWTNVWQTSSSAKFVVGGTDGYAENYGNLNDEGVIYSADATYPDANYKVSVKVNAGFTGTARLYLVARMTDQENMYALRLTTGAAVTRLYKKVSGTWTAMGSFNTDPSVGDVVTLAVNGSSISYYYNGVLQDTQTDTSLTSAGKAGIAAGGGAELAASTDDTSTSSQIDNFIVEDMVSFDSSAAIRTFDNGSPYEITLSSLTIGSNSNRVLVAIASRGYSTTSAVTGMTWNGEDLTFSHKVNQAEQVVEVWYLINPDTGNHDLVATYDKTTDCVLTGISLYNADQTDPIGITGSSAVDNTTGTSYNVTTESARSVLLVGASYEYATGELTDPPIGFTTLSKEGGSYLQGITAFKTVALAGTTAAGCPHSTGGPSQENASIAVEILPVGYTLEQEGFAFGDDDNSESTHSLDTQDTNITEPIGTKTIRAILNASGDPPSNAYKLKYQKNGSGGYSDVGVGASSAENLVIDGGDTTDDYNNTTSTDIDITLPAYSSGDLVIIAYDIWNNGGTPTVTWASGPNGETVTDIVNGYGASGSAGLQLCIGYFIATAGYAGGDMANDSTVATRWAGAITVVPAGEFDATTPIGAKGGAANSASDVTDITLQSFSAGSTDGGGKLLVVAGADQDPFSTTMPSGYTLFETRDGGRGVILLAGRNTNITGSETIATATFALNGAGTDAMAVYGFIVRSAVTTNEVYVDTSTNVASGGEDTTARLTAPSGKTTGDFTTGRRWGDENGTDSINIAEDNYTELEWVLTTQSPATTDDYFEFRVYVGDTPFDTYTVTPKWTIGAAASEAVVAPVSATLSVVSTTATYDEIDSAVVAPVSSTLSVPDVTATYQSVQTASVASVTSLLSVVATTATFISLWTAGVAPVTANLSTVDPTATYEQINTATVEPVVSSFSVVDPTATYVQVETADVDPVTSTMSVVDPTATYQAVINAAVDPVAGTLSVVETTATHSQNATASVDPVSGVLSVVDTTATHSQIESADVDPVSSTLSLTDTTATYIQVETSAVEPVVANFTLVDLTATYSQGSVAGVEPISSVFSLTDTTATYQEVDSAVVEPIASAFSVVEPAASYVQVETAIVETITANLSVVDTTAEHSEGANASVEPVSIVTSLQNVTATYQGIFNASVEPISVTLSVVDVGGGFHISAAVEPLGVTVSIPDVTGESDAIQTASVDPVVSTLSVVGVTATYIEIDTAQLVPVTGTLSVVETTATHSAEYTASVSAISITLSVVNVTATSSTEYVTDVEPVSIVLSIVTTQPTYIYVATASVQPLTIQISVVPIYAQTNIFLGPIQVSGRVRLGNVSGVVRSMTHQGSVNSKSVSGQNRSKNISAVNKAIVIE